MNKRIPYLLKIPNKTSIRKILNLSEKTKDLLTKIGKT